MSLKEKRTKVSSEILQNIREVKISSLQEISSIKIENRMEKELSALLSVQKRTILTNSLLYGEPYILFIFITLIYTLTSKESKIDKLLTLIFIISQLSFFFDKLGKSFYQVLESMVSSERVENFLKSTENKINMIDSGEKKNKEAIVIENCSFGIINERNEYTRLLSNINLSIQKGELIGVIGEIGSGKSLLLKSLMNFLEIEKNNNNSKVIVNGSIAYVSQEPWILNDTIRSNILFMNDLDQKKYFEVLSDCHLSKEISLLPGRDLTECSEKGETLSGGQRMRISIARAIYSDKEIYILDDPLSSLDQNIKKKIFNTFCKEAKIKGKTIIMATQTLQYLDKMDRIIFMDKGEVKFFGKYNEFTNHDFFKIFMEKYLKEENTLERKNIDNTPNSDPTKSSISDPAFAFNGSGEIYLTTNEENQEKKFISSRVLKKFIIMIGGFIFLIVSLIILLLLTISSIGKDLVLKYWVDSKNLNHKINIRNCLICCGLSFATFVFLVIINIFTVKALLNVIRTLHNTLVKKMLNASINKFFDITPIGQIFNRLLPDIDNLYPIVINFYRLLTFSFTLLGIIFICVYFSPYTIFFIIIILLAEGYTLWLSNTSYTSLMRLVRNLYSPFLSFFSESYKGIEVINGYKMIKNFTQVFHAKLDDAFKATIFNIGFLSWFGLRRSEIALILQISVFIFCYIFKNKITPAIMAILIAYTTPLPTQIGELFHIFTSFVNLFTSFERCINFLNLPQEDDQGMIDIKNFISVGNIKYEKVSITYRKPFKYSLRHINVEIEPEKKIGIVGRSGSGKSTFISALFRIIELSTGNIYIDDININKVNLNYLRRRMTAIPQVPLLFEGSLRENIDPENIYTDEEILNILYKLKMDKLVKRGLEQIINEENNNLSIGERQMICLARGLIKGNKIIAIDEISSSLDYESSKLIQEIILKEFKDNTILNITHRPEEVLNYDKVLVFKDGKIVEFDEPKNLLKNKKGVFYKLYFTSIKQKKN